MLNRHRPIAFWILAGWLAVTQTASAQSPGAPATLDSNLPLPATKLRTLDEHFPFTAPPSLDEWQRRASVRKSELVVALGLEPLPQLADPAEAKIYGRVDRDGFCVYRVLLPVCHGLYMTGSLFAPPQYPNVQNAVGVLSPHGHWEDGRFYRASDAEVERQIASGGEFDPVTARNPIVARAAHLARMGCIVLSWDMLGYADSQQISMERAHRWGVKSVNPEDATEPLLFSATAELYGQSVMGLQMVTGIAATKFLIAQPQTDAKKIAITGASGGGTQAFLLAALQPEISAAFPAVMVSTAMQGGCTCENACLLRVQAGNVELAATIAPRPLGLTAADDWTKNMPTDGFPALQQIYRLYGKNNQVELNANTHFPHNYNLVSRLAMYRWLNRTFELGATLPIVERPFEYLGREELSLWSEQIPTGERPNKPDGGPEWEAKLLSEWRKEIDAHFDSDSSESEAAKRTGWRTIFAPAAMWSEVLTARTVRPVGGNTREILIEDEAKRIVGKVTMPDTGESSQKLAKSLTVDFTALSEHAANGDTAPLSAVDPLLVPAIDGSEQPLVNQPRPAAAYTYGYNAPRIVRIAGVLLRAAETVGAEGVSDLTVRCGGADYAIALGCRLLRPDLIRHVEAIDDSFRFEQVESISDERFVPHALRYGDVEGLQKVATSTSENP